MFYALQKSPVGELLLIANAEGDALTDLHIVDGKYVPKVDPVWQKSGAAKALFQQTRDELADYFAGKRKNFTVKLAPKGTPFQQSAWQALLKIPFGESRTYGQQAATMGNPSAVRAVGAANGKNPIGIIVPCHRVIGANGSLTGYAGGLHNKLFLLKLEGIRDDLF